VNLGRIASALGCLPHQLLRDAARQ
jgi:hypothetical protein